MDTPADTGGLWFLARGGKPFRASTRKQDENPTWYAYDGDGSKGLEWRPIADLHRKVKEKSGSKKV